MFRLSSKISYFQQFFCRNSQSHNQTSDQCMVENNNQNSSYRNQSLLYECEKIIPIDLKSENVTFETLSLHSYLVVLGKNQKKEKVRKEESHLKEPKKKKCILLTMDMQTEKEALHQNTISISFKTKLSCHYFTVYNVENHRKS